MRALIWVLISFKERMGIMGLFKKSVDVSNKVFDWDAYYADISRGISPNEQKRKFKHFVYYVDRSVIDGRKATV